MYLPLIRKSLKRSLMNLHTLTFILFVKWLRQIKWKRLLEWTVKQLRVNLCIGNRIKEKCGFGCGLPSLERVCHGMDRKRYQIRAHSGRKPSVEGPAYCGAGGTTGYGLAERRRITGKPKGGSTRCRGQRSRRKPPPPAWESLMWVHSREADTVWH